MKNSREIVRDTFGAILIAFAVAIASTLAVATEPPSQRVRRAAPPPAESGYRHSSHMVPMRDGIKIATDVLLPKGEGPWPVLLFRTPYGRTASLNRVQPFLDQAVAYVTQDFRGLGDSGGKFELFSHEIDDGYDSVQWVAAQPWCNGKVGMRGGSGPGIGAKMAMIANPPNLVAVSSSKAASNAYHYCFYHGGVLRAKMSDWFRARGDALPEWPRPRTKPLEAAEHLRTFAAHGDKIQTAFFDVTGWYDIFLQSSLDDFVALKNNPHTRLVIGGTAHGRMQGLVFPADAAPRTQSTDWLVGRLKETQIQARDNPRVLYFLMGDVRDPEAPGNVWKQADTWPVPHTPTAFYFQEDGGLSRKAQAETAALSYAYDPGDPVPTIGGANLFLPKGPMDQRPLGKRKDILRFASAPLDEPLEITGKVLVRLRISTDVSDTTFMAKLMDVYPDGYEALILDSAVMARYWQGLDRPARLEKGRSYELTVDLWSTAWVFNKGHRIAVHIISSNSPRYEPHPNTYDPVHSYDASPVAHNTVHLGGQDTSHIILPVIPRGQSQNYEERSATTRTGGRRSAHSYFLGE